MSTQRRTRNNKRYSPDGSVVVVDRTGNHKANYMIIAEIVDVSYVVVFYSLRTAFRVAKGFERRFKMPMPVIDRAGKIVTHITK